MYIKASVIDDEKNNIYKKKYVYICRNIKIGI